MGARPASAKCEKDALRPNQFLIRFARDSYVYSGLELRTNREKNMRRRLFATMVLLSAVGMWTSPSEGEQPRSAPQKKGGGGMKGMFDPNTNFENRAKGRDHFYVSELGQMGASLQEYATSKGITDGKITREVYLAYFEQMKNNWGKGKKGGGM